MERSVIKRGPRWPWLKKQGKEAEEQRREYWRLLGLLTRQGYSVQAARQVLDTHPGAPA